MAQRQYKIQIQQPCRQNTADLTRREKGFFCRHCDKVILDFAAMSDEQLIDFLSRKHEGEICGVFSPQQMEKVYVMGQSRSRTSPSKLNLLLAGLLSLRLSVEAQQKTTLSGTQTARQSSYKKPPVSALPLKGKVMNRQTKQPLSAAIHIYADRFGTQLIDSLACDSSGHYAVAIAAGSTQRFFKVVYSCEGCLDRSVIVDWEHIPPFLPVTLERLHVIEVTVPEVVVEVQTVQYVTEGYTHAGVSPFFDEIKVIPRYKRFFRRIGFFFKKTFRLKR